MNFRFQTLAVVALSLLAGAVHAAWPDRPIRLIVPYPAGGAADSIARVVATQLSDRLKQQVLIENRAGAGGTIGALAVAQAPADGYTFLYDATSFAVNPSLFRKLGFSYAKDFAPVSMVARIPTLLVVPATAPVSSVAELVKAAQSPKGPLTYASAGNGSASQLTAAMFAQGFNVPMVHVPYKGGAPALTDLAGGQVQLMFSAVTASLPLVKAGKLKALATASPQRLPTLPELPTVAESGLPGFQAFEWNAVFAPAATPADILARMEGELQQVLTQPAVRQRLDELGALPAASGAQELDRFVKAETAQWARVIKAAGITLD
jgi:tripartite-type tricarboxylate transporter receptor subunit TctC